MSTKIEIASPLNNTLSPNVLNISDQFKFLMPDLRNCSPFVRNSFKSPNMSPIIGSADKASSFLKKREMKDRREKMDAKRRRRSSPLFLNEVNQIMEMTLSVKTVLKDLGLARYTETFYKEEINLAAFFTLTDDDLKSIGVEDVSDRKKILDFINDFSTPKKPRKIVPKNYLHRI